MLEEGIKALHWEKIINSKGANTAKPYIVGKVPAPYSATHST